jgi:hypothetical protein
VDSAEGDATLGAASPSVARLKTLLFTDQHFVTKAFAALRDGKTQDFEKTVNDKQLTVLDSDVQTLQAQASVSPSFDIRLAAGIYKINSPTSMAAISMTISPLDGMVSCMLFVLALACDVGEKSLIHLPFTVDNVHVENQTTDTTTGLVSWTTGQGANVFQAAWTTEFDESGGVKSMTFEGQTWPASQPANKTPFTGSKIIPDAGGGGSSWFLSATSQGITFVLSCLGMVPLVYASIILGVQKYRRRNADPAPAVAAAQPQAEQVSRAVESEVEASLHARPLDARPQIVSVLRQQAISLSRASASGARAGEEQSAVARVGDAVTQGTLRNAERETVTRLSERFRAPTLELIRDAAARAITSRETSALARRAAPDAWVHTVAERAVHSAVASGEARDASANLASAARELEEKQGEATQLRREKEAKEMELSRMRQAGVDPVDVGNVQDEVQRLEAELEQTERDAIEADTRRAEAERKSTEEEEAAKKAEEDLKDVEVIDLPE